jgi:methionyl-tRNA formyltransferase
MPYRVVFMGTPHFAIPTLQSLIEEYTTPSSRGQVVGVFTQPDRPSGRGRTLQPAPVKALALEHDLPVYQPKSLRKPEAQAEVRALRPDVIIVAAFGQIVPSAVLDLPSFGCINVHASLLPRWRGAAPVAAAILAGDDVTGVTIMKMDAGLDTGPIIRQRSLPIASDDTRESLTERLAQLGAELLRDTLPDWFAGNIQPQPQDEEEVLYAPKIEKEQGRIDWHEAAEVIGRQVRAFYPWPGAYTYWQDEPLKILAASAGGEGPEETTQRPPGTVIETSGGPAVVTGAGLLQLRQVQPAGKRPMPADAFVRGARGFIGARLPD